MKSKLAALGKVVKHKKLKKKLKNLFFTRKKRENEEGLDEEDSLLNYKTQKKLPLIDVISSRKRFTYDIGKALHHKKRKTTQLHSYPVDAPNRNFAQDFANALSFNRRRNKKMLTLADTLSEVSPSHSSVISIDSDSTNSSNNCAVKMKLCTNSPSSIVNSGKKALNTPLNFLTNLGGSLKKKSTKKEMNTFEWDTCHLKCDGLFDMKGNKISDDVSLSSLDSFVRQKKGTDR